MISENVDCLLMHAYKNCIYDLGGDTISKVILKYE